MANRIHVLEDQVANRIAAGEVIERPASVVKELVENALDSGADQIEVEVQKGGRSLVRVTDNGCGMSADDALLCLERHATSKLKNSEDLFTINSYGFRGEALPSIASVSKFRILTREKDSIEGTEVIVDGGKLKDVRSAGAAVGTMVEVRSLFFHTPGRRKFLRAETTEWSHIEQYLRTVALVRPHVGFKILKDSQVPLNWLKVKTTKERLKQIFGEGWIEETIPVEAEEAGLSLHGVVGRPGVARGTRSDQYFFVNGRPVVSRALQHGVLEGYQGSLVKGRFPIAVLFVELDPARVDVNVHPAKREVRFRDGKALQTLLGISVKEALLEAGIEPELEEDAETAFPVTDSRAFPSDLVSREGDSSEDSSSFTVPHVRPEQGSFQGLGGKPLLSNLVSLAGDDEEQTEDLPGIPDQVDADEAAGMAPHPSPNHDLRVLGTMLGHYLVAENEKGIVMIDRKAAHERILFERMMAAAHDETPLSQQLLLPASIELAPAQADLVRRHLEMFQSLGIGVDCLSGNSFMVDALPPAVDSSEVEDFFREVVNELDETGTASSQKLDTESIARAVTMRAVRVSDAGDPREQQRLLIDLHNCDLPYTCPRGRPTMILISERELARKFGKAK